MSVGFSRRPNPEAIPEHHLWTLSNGVDLVEARTRMTPLGPELRLYIPSRETGALVLLWSQVPRDGREVGELAEQERADYLSRGFQ